MHCICALKATCVDYIAEYNSKPDSMVARHERTTTCVHFTGMYKFLANAQSGVRSMIRSSRVNTTVFASTLHKCITLVEDRILSSRLCIHVKLTSCLTNLLSNSPRTCVQISSLN